MIVGIFFLVACKGSDEESFAEIIQSEAEYVSKIELLQGEQHTILSYDSGNWLVNGGRKASINRLEDWWSVALAWRVRPFYIDDATLSSIRSEIKRDGIRARLFTRQDKKPFLDFYICDLKNIGTVVLSGNKRFLVDLPYQDIKLMDVWDAAPGFWQEASVFSYLPSEMDTIKVFHAISPASSFRITRDGRAWFVSDTTGKRLDRLDTVLVNRYVTYFQQINADSIIGMLPEAEASAPYRSFQHRISISGNKGSRHVDLFGISLPEGGYDTDKCMLFIHETEEWAEGSWVSFDLLLRNLTDFVDKK